MCVIARSRSRLIARPRLMSNCRFQDSERSQRTNLVLNDPLTYDSQYGLIRSSSLNLRSETFLPFWCLPVIRTAQAVVLFEVVTFCGGLGIPVILPSIDSTSRM